MILAMLCLEQGRQAIHWGLVMISSLSGASPSPQMPQGLETLDPVLHVIGPSEAESKPPRAKPLLGDVFDRSLVLGFQILVKVFGLFAHLRSLPSHIAFSLGMNHCP